MGELVGDSSNDPKLCEDIDRGMSLGFSGELEPSNVFPPHFSTSEERVTEDEVLVNLRRSFRNYRSAESESHTVLSMIQDEVRLGRMRPLSKQEMWDEQRCFSRVAAIPKADCSELRLVEDYRRSKANERIRLVERVCLPRLRDIVKMLQHVLYGEDGKKLDMIGAILDLKGAYRHVNLLPEERRFCSVVVSQEGEKLGFEHLMIPFGVRSAPWGFCRLSSKLLRILKAFVFLLEYLQSFVVKPRSGAMVYIDDFLWLFRAATASRLLTSVILLILLVGVAVSWPKLCVRGDQIKFIGFNLILNKEPVMIAIPDAKLAEVKALIRSVIDNPRSVAAETLEPFLSAFYSRLAGLRKHGVVRFRISPQSDLFKVLRWWQDLLENEEFRLRLPVPAPFQATPRIVVASDASAKALGAWASCGPVVYWYKVDIRGGANLGPWRKFLEDPSSPSCRDMVFLETLAACLGLLLAIRMFALEEDERIWVSLQTDNTGTKSHFEKFRSPTDRVNQLLKAMAAKLGCIAYRYDVSYIASAENYYADLISRVQDPKGQLPESWKEVPMSTSSLRLLNCQRKPWNR
ncbi:hypothetical protein FOL47_001072, partial [Perkinsus chesapeaki]